MVFQKRLKYGINGYRAPRMPYVPKSARGKHSVRKKALDNRLRAFDLLAALAGKLLLEKESSLGSLNISQSFNCIAAKVPIKEEELKGKLLTTENINQQSRNYCFSDCVFSHGREINYDLKEHPHALIGASRESLNFNEEGLRTPWLYEFWPLKSVTDGKNADVVENQMNLAVKPSLINSDSSTEVPFYSIRVPENSTFSKHGDCAQISMNNDDDENSSGCTHSSILSNKASWLSCKRERRVKKLLASRHQKSTRTVLQRTVLSNYANGACSSMSGKKAYYGPSEHHVKFRMKTIKVPELFIEIPEIATVGALKRTVMDTVDALLGGGLQVGILLQGKKIQDDDTTLYQAGILHDGELHGIGFTLEHNSLEPPKPLTEAGDSHVLSHSQSAGRLARIPPEERNSDVEPSTSFPESDHDSIYSPADSLLLDRTPANSNVPVAAPPKNAELMAVVPLQKSTPCEIVQCRIRRPFTVSEVEALVQAIEELGTGRLRDVKLRRFENSKHRTYVDLKDKWKTLVHTAKNSPQQRRGEPVPQELLDRMLSTHAYWSQQQQAKSPTQQSLAHCSDSCTPSLASFEALSNIEVPEVGKKSLLPTL